MKDIKKIFLLILFILFSVTTSQASIQVIASSPWIAVLTNFIGGFNAKSVSLTTWEGTKLRGKDAVTPSRESYIIALDNAESEKLGLKNYPNLYLLYQNAPFSMDEKDYYFGDPSALPFIAQRVFSALSTFDRENFTYYQRQLSVFQTRLNSAILAGRHLLRGLRVFDLTGGSGFFLVAAGCEVFTPRRSDFRTWARGQQLSGLHEAIKNLNAVNGVVILDESTPKAIKTAAGANAISVSFLRPPVEEDFLNFLHNQYLLIWEQANGKVPAS